MGLPFQLHEKLKQDDQDLKASLGYTKFKGSLGNLVSSWFKI